MYFREKDKSIWGAVYISIMDGGNYESQMADMRVLLGKCGRKDYELTCEFAVASNEDLAAKKEAMIKSFDKMKEFIDAEYRRKFSMLIWDKQGLLEKEKQLGIKI